MEKNTRAAAESLTTLIVENAESISNIFARCAAELYSEGNNSDADATMVLRAKIDGLCSKTVGESDGN